MTALAAESGCLASGTAPVTLAALAARLAPIDLQAVLDQSALQTRRDRKYLLPTQTLGRMLDDLGADLSCLEISGDRVFDYRSVYFDTADLQFFRQHAQGRRHRIKVRTRTYVESGTCFVEVKSKGLRGVTVKDRIPHPIENSDRLTRGAEEFVAHVTDSLEHAGNLHPSLESCYRRLTLVDRVTRDRVTCDEDLRFRVSDREVRGLPHEILVETKTGGPPGAADRWLLANGIRPHSVSKYCVGIGLLYPHARANRWHRTLRRHFDWELPTSSTAA